MSLQERCREELVAKLAAGERKIGQLGERAKTVPVERRSAFEKELDELQDRRSAVALKIEELRRAEGHSWEAIKGEIEAAVDEWAKAIERAIARFR